MWTTHYCRYFAGICRDGHEQREFLEEFSNNITAMNNARARRSKHPCDWEECFAEAKRMCSAKGKDANMLTVGDIYKTISRQDQGQAQSGGSSRGGRGAQRGGRGRNNNSFNRRGGHNGGGQNGGNRNSTESKVAKCCGDYNDTGNNVCKFGNGCRKQHKCNYVKNDGFVCWGQHARVNHVDNGQNGGNQNQAQQPQGAAPGAEGN